MCAEEGRSPPESFGECSHYLLYCIFGHILVFLLFLSGFLHLTAMYRNTYTVHFGVMVIFFINAFIDIGCTELEPWMEIILNFLFTWKVLQMLLCTLSWMAVKAMEAALDW